MNMRQRFPLSLCRSLSRGRLAIFIWDFFMFDRIFVVGLSMLCMNMGGINMRWVKHSSNFNFVKHKVEKWVF